MSRIIKGLTAIIQLIKNPWLLNKVLDENIYWRKRVAKQYRFGDGLPVIRPEDLFGDFNETVEPFAFLDGGSLPTDLALLKKLARGIPGCSYFEIGTWRGESVANVASVADHCITLNLSGKEMKESGLSQRYIDLHRFFSKDLQNVTHLEGNTLSFDFQSFEKKFDLIFIDGDHRFEMVKNDTQKVFSTLVHDQTIVVWHDYARNPETIRYEVLNGILEGCPESVRPHLFHVAHTLCAVYIPGLKGGSKLDQWTTPTGSFQVDLKYKKA